MLSFENLKKLSSTNQASEKSKILADIISIDYLRNGDDLYKINNEFLTLELIDRSRRENALITYIQDLFLSADKVLSEDQNIILKTKQYTGYAKLSNLSNIKSIIQNIDEKLFRKIDDDNKDKIHFNNGYITISTLKFVKRTTPVKHYIPRNYIKSKKSDRAYMNQIYDQIYPIQDEKEYIFSSIASALSGISKRDRTSLFLLGKTQAGKSLLMQTLNRAFSNNYIKEFASDSFCKNNKNRDKIMNEFLKLQDCRICWVNELSGKLDDSLFKSFCEGSVKTISLYKDGMNDITHMSKIVLTSNELPNIRIDTGVCSRIVSHTHRSFFTEDDNDVDETKYIFKRNNNLIDEIEKNDNYKNAIIDIFLDYAKTYLKSGLFPLPNSMQNDKDEIISGNDYMQDFIDSKIETLKDSKISKNEVLAEYIRMYPTHKRTVQQMISSLKDKGYIYKSDLRCDGIKGCFIDIQFKQQVSSALQYSRSPLDIELIKSQKLEIEQLKKQILELQQNNKADIETEKVTTPKKLFISTPKKASTPKKTQKDDTCDDDDKLYTSNKQTSMNDMFLSTFNLVIE